jgi:ubiquinone/menaquinone biosynthesis C-methylase UbiE
MGHLTDAASGRSSHDGPMTTTEPPESFQIPLEVAEAYETAFVPAFFAQWAPLLCDAAGVAPGRRVLDVACGTGIVARTAADRVAPDGTVVGVDLNEAMLTVARRVRPDIEFRRGDASALPAADAEFDAVLCQMALMFFPDRAGALQEMARVAAPGATVAMLVPGALEHQVSFSRFIDVAARHAGPEARSLLTAYFVCGDLDELTALVGSTDDLEIVTARTEVGTYRAPSVDAFVTTEVESTPLVQRMTDEVYGRIRADARDVLAPFTTADERVEAPFEANLVVARRR